MHQHDKTHSDDDDHDHDGGGTVLVVNVWAMQKVLKDIRVYIL